MAVILDGGWRVGVSLIILKVDQPKIISSQVINVICFFSNYAY